MCFRESVEWFIEGAEQWTINSFECGSCRVVPARRGAGCELRLRAAAPEEACVVAPRAVLSAALASGVWLLLGVLVLVQVLHHVRHLAKS